MNAPIVTKEESTELPIAQPKLLVTVHALVCDEEHTSANDYLNEM